MGLIHKIEEKVLHHGDKKHAQQQYMYAIVYLFLSFGSCPLTLNRSPPQQQQQQGFSQRNCGQPQGGYNGGGMGMNGGGMDTAGGRQEFGGPQQHGGPFDPSGSLGSPPGGMGMGRESHHGGHHGGPGAMGGVGGMGGSQFGGGPGGPGGGPHGGRGGPGGWQKGSRFQYSCCLPIPKHNAYSVNLSM
jgi:hypothetical protein